MPTVSQNDAREQFDRWSETYERSFMQWLIFDRVHKGVLANLPPDFTPMHILDIGCGTGRLLRRMHACWPSARLVGVDLSEGMVTRARRLTPAATIYQAAAEHLPLEDDSIDLVTSTMSFHHWSDQAHGLSETSRVLHHGGIFILADVNIGHGHPLSPAQLRALFLASNFSIHSQTSPVPFLTYTIGEKL